jgi:hypothetical protein
MGPIRLGNPGSESMSPTKGRPRFEPGARGEAKGFPPARERGDIYIKEEMQINITDNTEGYLMT